MSEKGQKDPYLDVDIDETEEWLESLEHTFLENGSSRVGFLFSKLQEWAYRKGLYKYFQNTTPYMNTIPADQQSEYPGDRQIERRIKSYIRWNAMAMVVRGNKSSEGIGGHISSFASSATLFEVGLNHFFKAKGENGSGDTVFYQAHACPGIYARSFLEGRFDEQNLLNFRRELQETQGLSSYPHPWLMPDYWEFPAVSMGLAPIMSIYQAHFNRYLANRGIKKHKGVRVWAFLGDGETDEPETLGAIRFAAREKLDNLTFVINCNLQRLDGPVCGNSKIIQELEGSFRGAGWNVIKVVWGSEWDELLSKDTEGLLIRAMTETVDGEFQKYKVESGAYIRENFFGKYPGLQKLVEHLSDDQIKKLRWGGHDPEKVYNAYKQATEHKGAPTVILAKTVKGYGMGDGGEAMNVAHQQKKLTEDQLVHFKNRFELPLSDEQAKKAEFLRFDESSEEYKYLKARREDLHGSLPARVVHERPLKTPELADFDEMLKGTDGHEVSTTMAFVRGLGRLLKNKEIGERVVPIIPDEARTFGMDALFRQYGIYSAVGQKYEPVDSKNFLYYREATDGQIMEQGITEAGSMASFIAAGTSHATHGEPMIPFFTYYSMFGFQRVGDLIWAAADSRTRGFLMGGTAGRTTLNGEGLQHQDGHSHVIASTVPNLLAYDPVYAYEIAVIIQDGLKRMYQNNEDIFYYLTIANENYAQPAMPEGVQEGILKGMYKFSSHKAKKGQPKVQLLGSGSIFEQARRAQGLLEEFGVSADLWSVTSYKELRRDALATERQNRLNPGAKPKLCYLEELLKDEKGPFIAASDYMKVMSDGIAPWVPGGLLSLGTDGFGRSESREDLRRFFEVDSEFIAYSALYQLVKRDELPSKVLKEALKKFKIDSDKPDPLLV